VTTSDVHLVDAGALAWSEHPQFPGLFIKILETRATHPHASVTLTRLVPGCIIGTHAHPLETETAYVLSGQASLVAGGRRHRLVAGVAASIPPAIPHSLQNTGSEDVTLLAIHTPPVR
jgi:quercetin dioxygenase-like cupin family protein